MWVDVQFCLDSSKGGEPSVNTGAQINKTEKNNKFDYQICDNQST
jgi:hypothetical protein